jgi:hypothetical protein
VRGPLPSHVTSGASIKAAGRELRRDWLFGAAVAAAAVAFLKLENIDNDLLDQLYSAPAALGRLRRSQVAAANDVQLCVCQFADREFTTRVKARVPTFANRFAGSCTLRRRVRDPQELQLVDVQRG